jgi:predicted TIM-barrel fold metal-dependent hydrolase
MLQAALLAAGNHTTDKGYATGASPALLLDATDCDFRTSGSCAHDRVVLGEAGINRIVVDAAQCPTLAESGWRGKIRAVIDQHALETAGDLKRLHGRGVRAVRVHLDKAADAEALPALADRIVALGWHIEIDAPLSANSAVLAPAEWIFAELPVALCFSKNGGYDPRLPLDHPDVALLLALVRVGRAWIKLSDASHIRAQPTGDYKAFVATLLECRSDRIVWGSGIRHEADVARSLSRGIEYMVCDATERRKIMTDNPERLYRFDID